MPKDPYHVRRPLLPTWAWSLICIVLLMLGIVYVVPWLMGE